MIDRHSLYTELFHSYHQSLMNFCISQGVRPEDADDMVSEAFARAWMKAEQISPLEPKQQRAWLYSAITNIIKESRAKPAPALFSEIENIENYIAEEDALQQIQSEEDYQQYIKQIFNELTDEKEQEFFRLILEEKLDYNTLSQKYNASPGTLRVTICRFRKKLQKIVNKILIY